MIPKIYISYTNKNANLTYLRLTQPTQTIKAMNLK